MSTYLVCVIFGDHFFAFPCLIHLGRLGQHAMHELVDVVNKGFGKVRPVGLELLLELLNLLLLRT